VLFKSDVNELWPSYLLSILDSNPILYPSQVKISFLSPVKDPQEYQSSTTAERDSGIGKFWVLKVWKSRI
jgi:hypothetical protein